MKKEEIGRSEKLPNDLLSIEQNYLIMENSIFDGVTPQRSDTRREFPQRSCADFKRFSFLIFCIGSGILLQKC